MMNIPDVQHPHVRVLLTTFDGERWLEDQLASLRAQVRVRVSVVASDDSSSDRTPAILDAAAKAGRFIVLPKWPERFGKAHRNFMRVIRDTPLDDADHFALCDQDDIWLPEKLARAVEVLQSTGADAYGSNVTAFWSHRSPKLLVKSQPQRRFDYLFESSGPGCSFVFPRATFIELQRWVAENFEPLQEIKVHDWLIYAWARERGLRWVIDKVSLMLYRQHGRNEAGANTGWRAAKRRLRNILRGRFRLDALAIGDIIGMKSEVLERLRRMSLFDRVWLALHAREGRRSRRDALALGLLFLVMPKRRPLPPSVFTGADSSLYEGS